MSVVLRKMTREEFEVFYREGIEELTQEFIEELHFAYQDANKQAIKHCIGSAVTRIISKIDTEDIC